MNKKVDNIKLQKIFDPRSTQVAAEEKIKYLDLKAINDQYQPEINEAIAQVLDSGWYLNGNALKQFEEA